MLLIREARGKIPKKFIALFVVATIFAAFAPALATAPLEKAQVIIVFRERPNAALVTELGGEVITTYRIIPGLAARVPIVALEELGRNPAIVSVEPDTVVYALGQQVPWGISRIGAPTAWSLSTGAGVKVAILDTGIQYDHPDLAANIKGGISVLGETYSTDPAEWNDGNGHGTHVAGTVAAVNNDVGVVGSAPAAWLYAVKVLFDNGEGYVSDVIEGIDWSVQNGMQVINMSLGTPSDISAFEDACDRAFEAGFLLVAAAGKEGDGNPDTTELSYPAAYDSVIAVAATDSNDQVPSWSNSGPFIELAAPGVSVLSTYKGSTYATASGTSMAAPHVSGTAALVWARNPSLTNVQVRSILSQTAEDLGPAGRDTVYGYGLVRADEALQTNVLTLRPDASGEYTEYTTVSGTAEHWDAVDDVVPDEDNTYIETATAGHRDTFNLENSGLPDVPIYNVRVYARARKTKVAPAKINLMIRTYDNDHLSEDMTLTSSYSAHYWDWEVNPYTGGSWTVFEVDALEAGVRSASPRGHRVTQVYVDVTYRVPTLGVEVSVSPSYKSAPLGTALEYTVSVVNLGDVEDHYSLTVSDNAGWAPTLSDNSLVIPAGENRTTTLTVVIPENALPGTEDNITVAAISQFDNTVSASANCIAKASIPLGGLSTDMLYDHVILVVIDGVRPDVLLGANTPNFDALAAEGSYTWNAWTVTPSVTIAAIPSLMTGATPEVHQVTDWSGEIYAETMPEVFEEAGLSTALIGSGGILAGYNENTYWTEYYYHENADEHFTTLAIEYFVENRPFFMYVYNPMPDRRGHTYGHESAEYREAIENADYHVGRLVQTLKDLEVYDNTLIVITTDHGMTGTSHGYGYENDMRIFSIWRGPKVRGNYRMVDNVYIPPSATYGETYVAHRIIDIAPTITSLVGLRAPENSEGSTIYQIFEDLTPRAPIYIEGNENFTPANGVTSGSGTENDPYIVESWDISAENAHGIWITNTTAYFIIRDSYVHGGRDNGFDGIRFENVVNGRVDGVKSENNYHGVNFFSSKNNVIIDSILKNNYYGIRLVGSENNSIYHNNLENNTNQAYDDGTNYWDDSYPSGGNYWSDYTGADKYWGENQDILGSDGVGDTPYYIPGDNNRDRYPLVWTGAVVFGLVDLYTVNVEKILDLNQGSKLVVKFYSYTDAFENENVIEIFVPPWHVEENEKIPHPGGKSVKKVRLDLTYDSTENVISTIASFTVTQDILFSRIMDIKGEWPLPGADQDALFQEIMDIKAQWPIVL
jgi:parallel beta-helix repeat protein